MVQLWVQLYVFPLKRRCIFPSRPRIVFKFQSAFRAFYQRAHLNLNLPKGGMLTPRYNLQVASMFPERIDKMILDGVQNPHQYYHSPAYVHFRVIK